MRYKYNFTLDNSDSRRDVEKYFYKYGWPKTFDKLIQNQGEVIGKYYIDWDDTRHCCSYEFEGYGYIEVSKEKLFPFRKGIHIVY